ncbi:MAG: MlaD family protein [Acidobacteriota bacterium]
MNASNERAATLRVGILVLTALAVLSAGLMLLGERQNLFRRMSNYEVSFTNVDGLQAGNPVQLNGVSVGRVERVELPSDPEMPGLLVEIAIDTRYRARIRDDSLARIKTLGLLGDKYIELTTGSADKAVIEPGGRIKTAPATDVDRLIASGEDVVKNTVAISRSLVSLFDRLERGEGTLGQLMQPQPAGKPTVGDTIEAAHGAVTSANDMLRSVEDLSVEVRTGLLEGEGLLPRLIHDPTLADRLASSIERLDNTLAALEAEDGLIDQLSDPALAQRIGNTVASLERTSQRIDDLAAALEADNPGLLPRLIHDGNYADEVLGELRDLVRGLDRTVGAVTEGDGTVARLIHDPQIYEALQDVIVGVNESRFLRWLIRNRQKAGIRKRYQDAQDDAPPGGADPLDGPVASSTIGSVPSSAAHPPY